MASAGDFPSAFAKAERAAGRPLPESGAAFLSVRDSDKDAVAELGLSPGTEVWAAVKAAQTHAYPA